MAIGAVLIPAISHATLVTYLSLDSSTGLTAGPVDSGTNDATITALGKFGPAAQFDGDNDYFIVDAGGGVVGTGARTISLWVNEDVGTLNLRTPLTFGDNGIGTKFDIDLDNANDGIEVGVGNGRSTTSGVGFVTGSWQFLTVSLASGQNVGQVLAYLNGGNAITSAANTRAVATSSNRMLLGTAGNLSLTNNPSLQFFSGLVDDVAVWDEVLSQNEIKGAYDVGAASLAYPANNFDLLKLVHDAGSGSVVIGSLEWTYAAGLGGTAGLSGGGDNYTLVLDAAGGTGLTSAPVPEPASMGLLAAGTLLLARRRRQS